MIDISLKKDVFREAIASGRIYLKEETIEKIKQDKIEKGDVLTVAKVAGINAVKNTATHIPMCHQIPILAADFGFDIHHNSIDCKCYVKACYGTGVEMEAIIGVSIALLTIWDMVKMYEKDEKGQYPTTKINDIKIISKLKK